MKIRDKRGVIMKLEKDGIVIRGKENMLKMVKEYYGELFKKENLDEGKGEFFIRSLKRRLPEDERGKLGGELTVEEAYNVIKAMKANKVPGIDGLTKEFYVAFWDMVGIHLLGVFKEIMEGEEMSDSMKTGVVSILFKKGNPNHLDNYRPLTMLCVDYKILSKILANRLAGVMSHIVEMDQTCGVQGRQITWNLHLHRDVLTYVKERNIAAICVSLDQQKAFDRVDHAFLWKVMDGMGLGGVFTKWVKILYKGINSKIKINGYLTDKVQQTRGLRQGCPLSVVLFVLYAEPLACAIRESLVVKGITLPRGESLKISQYADDTILYLADDESLRGVIEILNDYEKATGSKINKEKTMYKYLGKWEGRKDNICDFMLCEGPMDILGISFGNKEGDALCNWKKKMTAVNRNLGLWKIRKLSISGKELVTKAEVLPKLLHLAYVFPMPQKYRAQLMRGIFKFIWGGYEYVKRVQMYQEIADGGKGVPNVPLKLDAIFYANVCTLLKKTYVHKCQILLWFWLSIPYRFLIGWDNKGPKAETRPEYFQRMVKWGRRHTECKEVDTIVNHKLLYKKLVQKSNVNLVMVSSEVWERAQDKSFKNGLKDFNWLHLHRRLPVRVIMHAHNLGKQKVCPRENCKEDETIEHVLWGCEYAKNVWDGVKGSYKCLEKVTYDEITSFGVKGVGKEQYKVLCMLLSIVKLKLWKARQGFITGVYKWGEIGTVKAIEKEFEGIYWHELEKWGSDTIKDRWKAFFLNPPKRRW
uniref:Reverse transcriptase domain-containing protein n=1 Tax=Haplochromis burtoni TaxID=8153 RepID=A0A3Q2X2I3_HAPBU